MSESEICILGSQGTIPGLENNHVKDILLFTRATIEVDRRQGEDRRCWEEYYLPMSKRELIFFANVSFSVV